VLEGLAETIQFDVAPHHGDILDRPIGHHINEEPDRIGERAFRRLEPDHVKGHVQEVWVVGKGLHNFQQFPKYV
jgi:hypothetical protein